MAILVANTAAQLTGKTLIDAEDNQTITGAKTFDRDPAAPFIVPANSAVVPNLNADSVDGAGFVNWTLYTPVFQNVTLGNGSVSGSYATLGKTTWFLSFLSFGSTTVVTPGLGVATTLPFASIALPNAAQLGLYGYGSDNSTGALWPLIGLWVGDVNRVGIYSINFASNGYQATTNIFPIIWATSDYILIQGVYEAA